MARLSDGEIARLLAEPKPLPNDYLDLLRPLLFGAHYRAQIEVNGRDDSIFRLYVRQSRLEPLDFSIGLVVQLNEPAGELTLRRYNGSTHEHSNSLERQRFLTFHIHTATERYQALGAAEEKYAEPTQRYADVRGALACMLADCGFVLPVE